MSESIEVVVVGGGYAGVYAANRLAGNEQVRVTLVNPRPQFVERIRLHQLVGGSDDAVVGFEEILSPSVRLVVDAATRIDAAGRAVELAGGERLAYDHLVYAVGSGTGRTGVPGAAEHAYPVATLEEATRLRDALDAARDDAEVCVVGAGLTGIETAAELAETGRRVTLVAGELLAPGLHPKGRRAIARRLARLGVQVLEGPMVTEVRERSVRVADGRDLPSAVTVWTAGFGVPDLAARSGLSTDADGRLLTDETLTSIDDVRIVAAGDAAAPSGMPYRMCCASANQMGPQAAQTVLARIEGREPEPVQVAFAGQCISLGRHDAVLQGVRRDDSAVAFHLAGRTATVVKELICRGTVWGLGEEARRPGRLNLWLRDPSRDQRVAARATPRPQTAAAE